jgi:hypothetical protein
LENEGRKHAGARFFQTQSPIDGGLSMATPRTGFGRELAKRWNLNVKHALYRETGDWYHQLERFPGALLDAHGFVIFETEEAFQNCPELRIRQDVAVPTGIHSIPGYVQVVVDGVERPIQPAQTSYEKALLSEGARVEVRQTRVERDPVARASCLKHYGYSCTVCQIDFGKRYGPIGHGFIHVHHLTPLAQGERQVDPIEDLRPLCPNCHAMVHRTDPPITTESLSDLLKQYEQVE